MSNLSDIIELFDYETLQIEQPQLLKKQTSLDSFISYEGVTESEDSNSEKFNNDIVPEQYKTS
ncbi:6842_t:CDS:1, partial [Dentiscutata erythropus]